MGGVKTFQQLFAENLAAFGWTVDPADVPDVHAVNTQLHWLSDWWATLDETTKAILRPVDLSEGLRQAGHFAYWPSHYDMLVGNPFELFTSTHNNVISCFVRARNAVGEQPEVVSDINEIVAEAESQPAS